MNTTQQGSNQKILDCLNKLTSIGQKAQEFAEQCQKIETRVGTGLLGLDIALGGGLTNELYILGAESSTGKSALMMAIAQHLARNGVNVLYFALEMSPEEFYARGISTISFLKNANDPNKKAVTASNILSWTYDHAAHEFTRMPYSCYSEYASEYFEIYGKKLYIIGVEQQGYTAKDIANISELFHRQHPDEPMAVFVDYLQIIKADSEDRSETDRKTRADHVVMTMKSLAAMGMPVFMASSISREQYGKKVSMGSFKESGDIEYTGGVLIGWDWHGVTDEKEEQKRKDEEDECLRRGFRKMSLSILKNRNSVRNQDVHLIYYPAYSYFCDENNYRPDVNHESPFRTWDKTGMPKNEEEKSERKQF